MHVKEDIKQVISTLGILASIIQDAKGVEITHTETAMILPDGHKMEYEVAE